VREEQRLQDDWPGTGRPVEIFDDHLADAPREVRRHLPDDSPPRMVLVRASMSCAKHQPHSVNSERPLIRGELPPSSEEWFDFRLWHFSDLPNEGSIGLLWGAKQKYSD
jgi:hypothetical protein